MKSKALFAGMAGALALSAGAAQAQVVTYSGYDLGTSAPGANTLAAQSAFLAATGSPEIIDFESALPSGVTIVGGSVLTTPPGAPKYWGSNVTPGGSHYLDFLGDVTFSFTAPINSFGLVMGGLQGPNTISWTNSSGSQQISVAQAGGSGFAFLGFTDFGESITSITVSSPGDYDGLDDVRFGLVNAGAIPEPATWAMLVLGFGVIGGSIRSRRHKAKPSFAAA